ncbi:MAG: hypothetical protein RL693_1340 [Verrucomicrobiota bacterium]|jgi:hypothetical protein
MKNAIIVLMSAALLILLSSCGPKVYSFNILIATDTPKGITFAPEAWWHEGYADICTKVRSKTYRQVNFCIVHEHLNDYFAYAFTGKAKGRVYVLKPSGLDGWEIVSEDDWTESPQDYFLKKTKTKLSN